MMDPEAALVEVASLLEEFALPYMVIGGLAVALWGEPRATIDVDLSLWVEPENLEGTIGELCRRLRCLPQHPLAFVERSRVLPAVTAAGVRVDLVFAAHTLEREAIGRAQAKPLGGKKIMVASVEDLILMKLTSEREKDTEDARRLLRRFRATLDRAYLEPRLAELAEALGRPDILTVFRRAQASEPEWA